MNTVRVSTLVSYLKRKLDSDTNLQRVDVSGEISNYHRHASGHLYFTLKDEAASLNCAMFRSYASSLSFEPKNGDKVILTGNISMFEKSGALQLYVTKIVRDGLGVLYQRYEETKRKLSEEGYFREEHKKEKDFLYPHRIAVLTGDRSAAMSDIRRGFERRWPLAQVDYYPVFVQGEDAPKDIIARLKEVDGYGYQCIILARGGGSFEDLFCFNDEELVKCIYHLNTFIVTGIGHEQDFTLADFAADLRAATPTAAVEQVTPRIEDVLDSVEELESDMNEIVSSRVRSEQELLAKLMSSRAFRDPYSLIERPSLNFDYLFEKLKKSAGRFAEMESRISRDHLRMNGALRLRIERTGNLIGSLDQKMRVLLVHKKEIEQLHLKRLETLVKAYSGEEILKRGYSLIYKDDKVITSAKQLKQNDEVKIHMADGTLTAGVKEVRNG